MKTIKEIPNTDSANRKKLLLPDIPLDAWCDMRKDYESGLSVRALGDKYICDPRTVRNCLKINYGSEMIGKRRQPKLLDAYKSQIERLCDKQTHSSLLSLSRDVTEKLKKEGFTGGERTVRNYLMKHPYLWNKIQDFDNKDQTKI